jgi:hypothetical protein
VQVGQLGQNRMLFGGAFQSPQRVGRSGNEPPAEDFLDELPPPAWREDEVSVECHAARVRVDRRDLNLFVVRDAKGQPRLERELPRRTHVEYVESDAQHAESKGEMIARAHWACGALDQLEPGPLRQFARVREEVPNALGGGANDVGRTNFHTTVSLTPYYTDARNRDQLVRRTGTRQRGLATRR